MLGGVALAAAVLGSGTAAGAYQAAWVDETTTSTSTDFRGMSCTEASSITTCVAVGNKTTSGNASIYRGATTASFPETISWTVASFPSSTEGLEGVSCASASVCTAVGDYGHIVRSTDGGKSWTKRTSPVGISALLLGIGCTPSNGLCIAVGDDGTYRTILRSTDGGATWAKLSIALSGWTLAAVDCVAGSPASSTTCVATGYGGTIVRTIDGGATWTEEAPPPAFDLLGVSCTSTSNCVAVDNGGFILRYASGSWTKVAAAPDSFTSVSCSGTSCFAVGYRGLAWTSADSGATWAAQTAATPLSDVFGVSCTASRCRNGGLAGRIQKI